MSASRFGVFLIFLLLLTGAKAEFMTGNKLKIDLDSVDAFPQGYSLGYVVGVADAVQHIAYCPPSGAPITQGQVKAVVKKYFDGHPEKLNLTADQLVTQALRETWPCAAKSPNATNPSPAPAPTLPKPRPRPEDKSPF